MRNTIGRCALAAFACISLAVTAQAKEDILKKFIDNYRAPFDSEVQLGVWHGDLDKCKELSEKHGIPMIAIWSHEGCAHCEILEKALMSDAFCNWAKTSGLILCFTCDYDPKGQRRYDRPDGSDRVIGTTDGAYYWFCKRPEMLSSYPYVRFYWYEDDKKRVDTAVHGDKVDGQQGISGGTYDKAGQNCINYIVNKSGFKPYLDNPESLSSYMGGQFEDGYTDGNRLEAEAGTGEISFDMVRAENVAAVATNNTVKVVGPDKQVAETVVVEWEEGEDQKTVTVDMSKVNFSKNGDKALLIAVDADGNEQATNTVTYVTGSGESSSNPLWIGERKATTADGDIPVLQYGEWTMDLDVAKAKVAAEEGQAYTLVAVGGCLWCPDCANTERNFTEVKDGSGNNRLATWAAANKVALVAIDIPNFKTNSVEAASPTLLSRTAYTTTLARAKEYPASGADPALTNAMARSGLGYLTRKGVSDADALAILERNHDLVTTDISKGGFHSAADSSKYRTNVPIFVVLDKAGNVKGRLVYFGKYSSPMAADAAKWDDVIKRFDEMLAIAKDGSAHADGGVVEDDFPCDGIHGIAASGGNVSGEISHCDFLDTYKLENFDGNAFLLATVDGMDDAEVTLSIVKLDADGKKVTVASETGALNDGVVLSAAIETSGEFFIEISGASYAADAFSAFNPAEQAFHAYEIDCAVILIPGEMRSKAVAPEGSSTVSMLIEAGELYRIEGLADDHGAALLKVADNFYVSTVAIDDGYSYEDMKTSSPGGTVVYQRWEPGVVGFVSEKRTVTESVGDVKVEFARELGTSGEVTVRVSVDETATTLYNSDGAARFEFSPVEFTWAEGESGTTNAVVAVKDDARFDGPGVVVLKLEVVSSENSDVEAVVTTYTLTVNEDDKQSAGKVAFTGAEPFFSKKATVYARESEGATVYAERIEASDGFVTVKVNATNGAKTEIGGVETNVIAWANHKYESQAVKVTGIAAGKSAKLMLAGPTDGLKVLTASNTVTVVAVADDAPAFEQDEASSTLYRYVATSNVYPVVFAESVDASAATLSFRKLSGTLPAGLTAKYDATAQGLAIFGATTAKPGVYTMVYQAVQKVGTKATSGLTIEINYTVVDPTAVGGEGEPFNEAVATSKSRTFKNIPVIDGTHGRLVGLLQVTIPATGKVSAKYSCSVGTVSFTAKGWSSFDTETKALAASLTSSKSGYAMSFVAENDGSVSMVIDDPTADEGSSLKASFSGSVWSKANPASTWAGLYTLALKSAKINEAEGLEGVAPRGDGYLTLKMNTTSAINAGTVTWAGVLPNGKAVSGSSTLIYDALCDNAELPVYKRSTSDVLSAIIDMCTIAQEDSDVGAFWQHTDKYEETSYLVDLDIHGSQYSASANLADICLEGYETTTPTLSFGIDGLLGWTSFGEPSEVAGVQVTVLESTLKVAGGNAAGATLSFNRATGVVSGSFKIPCTADSGASKTVTATYKGVVLFGLGEGCGCGDPGSEVVLPFVVGGFTFSDKIELGNGRKVSVKRGGTIAVDK